MAIIVFGRATILPIAPLRQHLDKHLPLYRWRIGEDDDGSAECMGPIRPHQLVMGRTEHDSLLIEIIARDARHGAPAPPHSCHLEIGRPTTEQQAIADRATLVLCATLMQGDAEGSWCQLAPGGNWLSLADVGRLFKAVIAGESIALADGLGVPADRIGDGPAAERHSGGFQGTADKPPRSELGALIVLADRELPVDDATLVRFAREIDPDGDWQAERHRGSTILVGRRTIVGVVSVAGPLPAQYFDRNWTRSHWFEGDRDAIRRHARHLTIKSTLDARTADWVTIRQVAKIATLAACWMARQPGALAIVNLDVGTTFAATDGARFLDHLGGDELPVALWTWTQWHGLDDGDVSLSTSGLQPFLGHEIEAWHAPLPAREVQDSTSNLIRYLLANGPVIGHNDTAGKTAGDTSIRCFLGPSRATRPQSVQALLLEFDGGEVTAPRPDLPQPGMLPTGNPVVDRAIATLSHDASPELQRALGDLLAGDLPPDDPEHPTLTAIVAMTTPGTYPINILAEQLAASFPDFVWDVDAGADAARDRIVIGRHGATRVTARFEARAESLPAAIPAPPHLYHLRIIVDAGDDIAFARRLALVFACCLVISIDEDAHIQLSADGNWLNHDDALTGIVLPRHGADIGDFDRVFGVAPATFAGRPNRFPDAYPPATDGFETRYLARTCPPGTAIGAGLRDALLRGGSVSIQRTEVAKIAPPIRRATGFGRKGL